MSNDADEFLTGGGDFGPSARPAKWGKLRKNDRCVPGTVEKGQIVEDPFLMQQREYKADGSLGDLLFWNGPDGKTPDLSKPRMQLKVIIQTEHRTDDEDDGRRAIFVSGPLKKAIVEAIKAEGATGLRKGGWLAVLCKDMTLAKSGYDTYIWEAKYRAPAPADDFLSTDMEPPAPTQEQKVAEKVAERRSTLRQIQDSGHQASLRKGFDEEPPF